MLSLLANLLKALNSESAPGQVSLAVAFSAIVAFTPFFSLHNILILLIVLVVRTNLSGFLVGYALFAMLSVLVDPWSIRLGESLLANPGLMDTWVALYQSEFWRMTAFNHTLTLGGFVIGVMAFAPIYLICNVLIRQYRARFMAWFLKLKVVQALQATKFFSIYQSLAG